MLSTAVKSCFVKVAAQSKTCNVRSFSEFVRTIPNDAEQAAGRRKQEIDAENRGESFFSMEPIIPPSNAGTKENPILVPSYMGKRTVGFEHPYTHQLVWFNLINGPLHFVPDTGLYFKLADLNADEKAFHH